MTIKRLFTQLKISIYVIAIIPTLLVTMLIYFASKETISQSLSLFGSEMQGLNQATYNISREMKDNTITIINLGINEDFIKSDLPKKQTIAVNTLNHIGAVRQVQYFDASGGRVFQFFLHTETEESKTFETNPLWIQRALAGEVYQSKIKLDKNNHPWMNITVPILSEDRTKITGAISVNLSLQNIFSQFKRKNGIAYILDERGKVVYVTGDLKGQEIRIVPGQIMTRAPNGGYDLETTKDNLFLVSFLPIGDTGWQLIWKTPLREMAITSKQAIFNFAGAFAVAFLFAILLSFYLTHRITKPLESLTEATREMPLIDEEQIQSLVQENKLDISFEEMRNRLTKYAEDNKVLFSKTKENLENRVRELRAIHSITETFATVQDFPEMLSYIVDQVQSTFNAKFCNLYLKNCEGSFVLKAHKCEGDLDYTKYSTPTFHNMDQEPFTEMKETLHALIIPVAEKEKSLRDKVPVGEIGSYCVYPLFIGNNFFGILEIGLASGNRISEGSIKLLATLVREASIAIENARLYHKMSEEKGKIEAIMSTISDGVISMDESCIITSFNRAAEVISGIPKEKAVGVPCYKIFKRIPHEDTPNRKECPEGCTLIKAFKNQREFPFQTEHVVKNQAGDERVVEFSTTLEKDDITGKISFVSVFRDISQIKEMERLRSDFVDTISHELRTPLTAIKSYVAALLHPHAAFTKEETNEFLQIVNEESNRLNRMINDLLEASRLHRGTLIIKLQPYKIKKFIDEVIDKKQKITQKHTFIVNVDEDPVISVDPRQVEYVIDHLLENAIKFSPDGGQIKLTLTSYGSDDVMISIEDQGIGIPEDQREKIFNMFHRVDNRSTRRIYGPGLGLFLSKKILQAHGRNIWVETGFATGAKFVFTLPKHKEDENVLICEESN